MAQAARPRNVIIYRDENGKEPFTEWLEGLRNPAVRRRILARLRRVEQGNFGDYRALQEGVLELRFTFGPGYRVYFGEDGDTVVVVLGGGDKSSQDKDIEAAKTCWKEYQSHA
jgi:putative addiction module killer protein